MSTQIQDYVVHTDTALYRYITHTPSPLSSSLPPSHSVDLSRAKCQLGRAYPAISCPCSCLPVSRRLMMPMMCPLWLPRQSERASERESMRDCVRLFVCASACICVHLRACMHAFVCAFVCVCVRVRAYVFIIPYYRLLAYTLSLACGLSLPLAFSCPPPDTHPSSHHPISQLTPFLTHSRHSSS